MLTECVMFLLGAFWQHLQCYSAVVVPCVAKKKKGKILDYSIFVHILMLQNFKLWVKINLEKLISLFKYFNVTKF